MRLTGLAVTDPKRSAPHNKPLCIIDLRGNRPSLSPSAHVAPFAYAEGTDHLWAEADCMITRVDGFEIWLASGQKLHFQYTVKSVAVLGSEALLVILQPPSGSSVRDQVFCIEPSGRVRWQIQQDPQLSGYFTGITRAEVDGITVFDWDCFSVDVDPATGAIIRKTFTK